MLLLKKRRKPTRSIDEGLKSVFSQIAPNNPENGEINPQRPRRRKPLPEPGPGPGPGGQARVSEHKQALCDNIDAWALWVSPPVFLVFNCIYLVLLRSAKKVYIRHFFRQRRLTLCCGKHFSRFTSR